jgi:hypothetical protein
MMIRTALIGTRLVVEVESGYQHLPVIMGESGYLLIFINLIRLIMFYCNRIKYYQYRYFNRTDPRHGYLSLNNTATQENKEIKNANSYMWLMDADIKGSVDVQDREGSEIISWP